MENQKISSSVTINSDITVEVEEITDDDLMEEDEAGCDIIDSYACETPSKQSASDISLVDSLSQDSPTSPTSPPLDFSDPEEDFEDDRCSPPVRPETPTPPPILVTSSPLSPTGSRRALQCLTPKGESQPSVPQTPTGNKRAHQSKIQHYSKLRSKLRKDRERELMSQKGVMGKNRLEDRRIRERMVKQLRKNLV
ncbi:hypothetical protein ABW20_dc0110207 [Dactylellina cionopaga]|nr:hypothetical protein ABW20_dc0110207 [Dactylellina cionopaga]